VEDLLPKTVGYINFGDWRLKICVLFIEEEKCQDYNQRFLCFMK